MEFVEDQIETYKNQIINYLPPKSEDLDINNYSKEKLKKIVNTINGIFEETTDCDILSYMGLYNVKNNNLNLALNYYLKAYEFGDLKMIINIVMVYLLKRDLNNAMNAITDFYEKIIIDEIILENDIKIDKKLMSSVENLLNILHCLIFIRDNFNSVIENINNEITNETLSDKIIEKLISELIKFSFEKNRYSVVVFLILFNINDMSHINVSENHEISFDFDLFLTSFLRYSYNGLVN